MGPPYPGRSLQLMGHIFYLLMFCDPQQMELLLNGVEPFIHLERFFGHLENRRLGVQEILESVVLIRLRPLLLLAGMSRVLHNEA